MKKIFLIIVITSFLAGCEKKFLDVKQPGVVTISTTQDYDLLLNSDDYTTFVDWPVLHLSDNFEFDPTSTPSGPALLVYTWDDQPYGDQDPGLWSMPYKAIYLANLVINEVDNSSGGTKPEKDKLKGEAYLGRAFMHFALMQIYAKPYNAATAESDPGIPYVTLPDMYAKTPERSTVKGTYDKILADLDTAITLLPATTNANFRGSKAGAFGLLSRIYLHLKDYDKAAENADAMLASKNAVMDYTAPGFVLPAAAENTEQVYMKMVFEFDHPFSAILTAAGEDVLSQTDKRRSLYVSMFGYSPLFSQFGISVPEVMLTKAEALVRKNSPDVTEALNIINTLNAKRDETHTDLVSTDAAQVLSWVLDERRRELIASPVRWYDMRRLVSEGRIPAITRTVGADTYTLEPDSKKYTLMIPASVINFNPGMEQNER